MFSRQTVDALTTGQSKFWVFTSFLVSDTEKDRLLSLVDNEPIVFFIIFGLERCPSSGRDHYQGFVAFRTSRRFNQVRAILGQEFHIERKRGSIQQAIEYCTKDGTYFERGTRPVERRGSGDQFAQFEEWIKQYYADTASRPSERDIARAFPALFLRYSGKLLSLAGHLLPSPVLQGGELRGWQLQLLRQLDSEPDDRTVFFYVDLIGGRGKTFFQRYMLTNFPDKVQLLGVGKREDLTYAIDETKRTFLFNVPRGSMQFVQYNVFEMIKDRFVFSNKYHSTTKILSLCHVVVFSNEWPDESTMTADRYRIVDISREERANLIVESDEVV